MYRFCQAVMQASRLTFNALIKSKFQKPKHKDDLCLCESLLPSQVAARPQIDSVDSVQRKHQLHFSAYPPRQSLSQEVWLANCIEKNTRGERQIIPSSVNVSLLTELPLIVRASLRPVYYEADLCILTSQNDYSIQAVLVGYNCDVQR